MVLGNLSPTNSGLGSAFLVLLQAWALIPGFSGTAEAKPRTHPPTNAQADFEVTEAELYRSAGRYPGANGESGCHGSHWGSEAKASCVLVSNSTS